MATKNTSATARERKERIDEALRQHAKLSEQREKRKKGDTDEYA